MLISSENPLFPITINDYPKLFDYVLTSEGLKFYQILRRQYVLGKELSLDEYNKLRLLCIYYAAANRNTKEVSFWQDLCITLDENGIPEKNMYQSKEDLISKLLIVKNPSYQSGLYRKHTDYVKNNFKSKDN